MTETLYPTYRAGTSPPRAFALQEGELYVEYAPAGGGNARLWVGLPASSGAAGNIALLVGGDPSATPSTIAIDPMDNPSPQSSVHISGTVDPGVVIELAALQGLNEDYLIQVTDWSPWDATQNKMTMIGEDPEDPVSNPHLVGGFDMTWWLPLGDNYRIRVRMQQQPQTFVDSTIFSVEPD